VTRKKVKVQVHVSHLDRLTDVAEGLRKAGMTIVDQIDELGHFSGLAQETSLARLEAVPGVKSVRTMGNEGESEPADYSIS
jgi:hypothetical protein